jgi:O-methyltransferase
MGHALNRVLAGALTSTPLTARLLPPLRRWRRERLAARLYARYRDVTMTPPAVFADNLALCAEYGKQPGLVVECGVWRGGMSAAIAEVLGPAHVYYLFDSFEGLPPADLEKDGQRAVAYQADPTAWDYFDNCRAEIAFAEDAMRRSGVPAVRFVKGWYRDTLCGFIPPEPIVVLRLDADWYESTRQCLQVLFPHVARGGLMLIDDYYSWDGCTRAVHEYLAQRDAQERIRQSPAGVAYLVKGT